MSSTAATLVCPAQTYDGDVRDVYDKAEAATDKWLCAKREEEEKQKEARVLGRRMVYLLIIVLRSYAQCASVLWMCAVANKVDSTASDIPLLPW